MGSECNGEVDNCCLPSYCGKSRLDGDDESTKCMPLIREGRICSSDGVTQDWLCADYMQCIKTPGKDRATCQEVPAGDLFCGFDSRAEPDNNLVQHNSFCDKETQYCGSNPNTNMPECFDYLKKGEDCTSDFAANGWVGECEEGLICKFTSHNDSDPAQCVDADQCIPDWHRGCRGLNGTCCNEG
eukprot:Clim_evm1s172 gene=Clim_evmTU1s172